jgi:hypothetical protein
MNLVCPLLRPAIILSAYPLCIEVSGHSGLQTLARRIVDGDMLRLPASHPELADPVNIYRVRKCSPLALFS